MRYLRAYKFAFDHPLWARNWLLGAVCCLIPVVGPIVYMGWLFEVIEGFVRRGESTWTIFDFSKFGQYLTRGVWPFLVGLILGLVVMPIVLVMVVLWMVYILSSKGQPDPLVATFFIVGMMVVSMLLGILLNLVKAPMILRAGLTQELGASFSKAYALDFLKKMWLEVLIAGLFLAVTSIPIVLLGELCCIIGIFPAMALVMMAEHHLYYQLYMLYLQRGGMAISLKPEPGTMAPEAGPVTPA